MNATPEIREKILEEITRILRIDIKSPDGPEGCVYFSRIGFIGGVMKGLEIMEVTDINDFQNVRCAIMEVACLSKKRGHGLSKKTVRAILEKHLKEDENE